MNTGNQEKEPGLADQLLNTVDKLKVISLKFSHSEKENEITIRDLRAENHELKEKSGDRFGGAKKFDIAGKPELPKEGFKNDSEEIDFWKKEEVSIRNAYNMVVGVLQHYHDENKDHEKNIVKLRDILEIGPDRSIVETVRQLKKDSLGRKEEKRKVEKEDDCDCPACKLRRKIMERNGKTNDAKDVEELISILADLFGEGNTQVFKFKRPDNSKEN